MITFLACNPDSPQPFFIIGVLHITAHGAAPLFVCCSPSLLLYPSVTYPPAAAGCTMQQQLGQLQQQQASLFCWMPVKVLGRCRWMSSSFSVISSQVSSCGIFRVAVLDGAVYNASQPTCPGSGASKYSKEGRSAHKDLRQLA